MCVSICVSECVSVPLTWLPGSSDRYVCRMAPVLAIWHQRHSVTARYCRRISVAVAVLDVHTNYQCRHQHCLFRRFVACTVLLLLMLTRTWHRGLLLVLAYPGHQHFISRYCHKINIIPLRIPLCTCLPNSSLSTPKTTFSKCI